MTDEKREAETKDVETNDAETKDAKQKEAQRRVTARHEAGHAVAALHYDTPIEYATIEAQAGVLGTTRLGMSKPSDAITIFCGPLAEREWAVFRPGAMVKFQTVGTDHESVLYLRLTQEEGNAFVEEAMFFLRKPEVQQQIEKVAQALLDRNKLSPDEIREAAAFDSSLAWKQSKSR